MQLRECWSNYRIYSKLARTYKCVHYNLVRLLLLFLMFPRRCDPRAEKSIRNSTEESSTHDKMEGDTHDLESQELLSVHIPFTLDEEVVKQRFTSVPSFWAVGLEFILLVFVL